MNRDKINSNLQLVANLGIILGLVLVGFQMKQNSDLLKAELLFRESDRLASITSLMVGENPAPIWAKAMSNPLELTPEEQVIMEGYYFLYTENWRSTYKLKTLGLIDDEWKERIEIDSLYLFQHPYGRAYWEVTKNVMPPELVEHVEFVLENNPLGASGANDYYDQIMEETAKYEEILQQ